MMWSSALKILYIESPPWLRSRRSGLIPEGGHDLFGEAAHRRLGQILAERTEVEPGDQVVDTGLALQEPDAVDHPLRRAEHHPVVEEVVVAHVGELALGL